MQGFSEELESFKQRINDDFFKLAVIGGFSSGKSTFINALIGRDILSHATKETTAVLTRIINVDENDPRKGSAVAFMKSGEKLPIKNLDELKKYTTAVSTKYRVAQDIDVVEIYIPLLNVNRSLMIMDTPGLNGIAEGHLEQTKEIVKKAHACIYLIQQRGLTKDDLEFLRENLVPYQRRFIFVQNFIDEFNFFEGETLEDRIISLQKILAEKVFEGSENHKFFICGVSALQELVSRDETIKRLYADDFQDLTDNDRKKLAEKSNFKSFRKILEENFSEKNLDDIQYRDTAVAILHWKKDLLQKISRRLDEDVKVCNTSREKNAADRIDKLIQRIRDRRQDNLPAIRGFISGEIKKLNNELKKIIADDFKQTEDTLKSEINSCSTPESVEKMSRNLNQKISRDYEKIAGNAVEYCKISFQSLYQLVMERLEEYSSIKSLNSGDNFQLGNLQIKPQQFQNSNDIAYINENINRKKTELSSARRNLSGANSNIFNEQNTVQSLNYDKEDLQRRINQKQNEIRQMGSRPAIRIWYETVAVERNGFFGSIMDIFSTKTEQQEREDDSKGIRWDEERRRLETQKNSLVQQLEDIRRRQNAAQRNLDRAKSRGQDNYSRVQSLEREIQRLEEQKQLEEIHFEKEKARARENYIRMIKNQIREEIEKYFNGEAGIVYYRDGTTKTLTDLTLKTIERFVSTNGDANERTIAQTVEKVDLFLDSKFLEDGVMLVDSPGLNGINEKLEEITRRQIKESHACIFMFSTDHPGTKTEFEILRDLREECQSIFIVLNKIEEIKASEGETVESIVNHLKENYLKQFPDSKLPEIYPISAYTALAARDKNVPIDRDEGKVKDAAYYENLEKQSRLDKFEDRLFRYLTEGERTREQLSEPVNKVANVLKGARENVEEQIKVLEETRSTADLEQQKIEFEEAISKLQKERQTLSKPVNERFQNVLRDFKEKIRARCDTICVRMENTANEVEKIEELQDFAAELPNNLKKQFVKLSQRLEDDLREDLMLVVNESVEYFDGLQETLENVSGGGLKIHTDDLKLTVTDIGKNMAIMEKEFAEKRREMERIESEIGTAELNRAKSRKMERQKETLQSQLREIANRRNAVIDTFIIPEVERRTRTVKKLRDRRGIGGFFAELFVGKKEYDDIEETVDSTAHDEAKKMRDEILGGIDSERAQLIEEIEKYSDKNTTSSEEFDDIINQKSKLLDKMNEKYKADVEKYMASLDADTAKARKKICGEIKSYIDEFSEENIQGINRYLIGIEKQMFDTVKSVIEGRVNAEIEYQQKKIDRLIEDSKASVAERDEKLQKAVLARENILELLGRVVEIETDIDEMNDKIIEEA